MKIPLCVLLFISFFAAWASAGESPRQAIPLSHWEFAEDQSPANSGAHAPPADAAWKPVEVPHVFRQSGLPDDAAGWYRQVFPLAKSEGDRRIFLNLEGAASIKDVYVNGQHIGTHKGAFSGSYFDLTSALKFGGSNTLHVRVSNRESEAQNCFSRSTLFYVNGGMFRKAWLVKTGAVHIFPDMGSSGVYLTPRNLTSDTVELEVRTFVRNPQPAPVKVTLRYSITDPAGTSCGEFEKQQTVEAGETMAIPATQRIKQPKRWDFQKPNLYTVRVQLAAAGAPSDEVTERTGFRTIAWKGQRFYLNDREVQFRGVNKHEQNEYAWNAVSDDEPRREWQSMIDMGVNCVRLPHYPHSHLEYNIADESGVAVWAENGYAGQHWKEAGNDEKTITPDGERLTREMVRQNWNHPSILFWSAGNETVLDVVSHYAGLIREEQDPTRLVTYASCGGEPKNCDFVAQNTYDGWYGNRYNQFSELPRNALVSETGSGDWITHHVPYGTLKWSVDKYEPEEYSEMFTEYRLQTICRDDVANRPLFLWWNFREFYNLKFKKNRNTKGLLTLAGMPKDSYFLFQAFLNPGKPVVHLDDRHYFLRQFAADNGIKAYSNAAELQLVVNGVPQEKMRNGAYHIPDAEMKNKDKTTTSIKGIPVANVFFWKTPLRPGKNVIEVADGHGHQDRMVIYQKTTGEAWPADHDALVQELESSNPANPAYFIDRPVEAQGPVYTDVDGSSDNTFDLLPPAMDGARWIATRRLSDPKLKTDLAFRLNPAAKEATVSVLFSTGTYPTVTLKKPDSEMATAAAALQASLAAVGFKDGGEAVWRDQQLNRTNARIWSRKVKGGEKITLPGQTLDYVVLVQPAP